MLAVRACVHRAGARSGDREAHRVSPVPPLRDRRRSVMSFTRCVVPGSDHSFRRDLAALLTNRPADEASTARS
jgi:hypothetical protein